MKIPFFKPYVTGKELKYVSDLIEKGVDIGGDGPYTKKVHEFLEKRYDVKKALLTTSGTTALEMTMHLLDLKRGDEVIVPSFTFTSTANAVLLQRGVRVIFADIDPHTLNIDPDDLEKKITDKTRAVIVVHYAGVACDMGRILEITKRYNLKLVEDAAQAIEAKWQDRYLGTIGDFGCLSFHETKNITCGEGGALFINTDDKSVIERAEIIREKGTNRSKFFRGEIDKYTWVNVGSSYLPSDILAAFLYAQLERVAEITSERLTIYETYRKALKPLEEAGKLKLPMIPSYATHNAHIFYILLPNSEKRTEILTNLRSKGVGATFHYIPLHTSPLGKLIDESEVELPITQDISERLIRLPIFAGMKTEEYDYVIKTLTSLL